MLQLKKFPDIPVSTREEARGSRTHPEEPGFHLLARDEGFFPASSGKNSRLSCRISRRGALNRKGERNPSVVPQFQGTPNVSVDSRGNCFPCTASTFKPRIHSLHHGTWDSPVGKPHRKASRESHRSLDPPEGKGDTAARAQEESARACPHSTRGLTPLGRLQKYPKIHVSTGEQSSGSGPNSTQGLRSRH